MTLYTKENPETIQLMFDTIAKRYDRGNAVISLGMHRLWNNQLIKKVMGNQEPDVFLDLCSGTGDIAFNFLKKTGKPTQTYLVDFSCEMLECAKIKALKHGFEKKHKLSYIQADVQKIPLPNEIASCATVAYGIRNVQNPSAMMQETFRVLKPGGQFAILELTRPTQAFLKFGHSIYLKTIIPLLGKWVSSDEQAYHYLQRSIEEFVTPSELEKQLIKSGFVETSCTPLFGGIATIIYGKKPL